MTWPPPAETFLISAEEFDVCWEILDLGETPVQLDIPSPGRSRAARREVLARCLASLGHRGLAGQRGPVPALAGCLGLLAQSEWSVDAHLLLPHPITAIGAVRERRGVVAARRGDRVWIATMDEQRMIPDLVDLAGDVPPGPGESASVRAAALTAAARHAAGDPLTMTEELIARGEHSSSAAMLAQMAHRPIRQGQFGASVVADSGVRRRASRLVTFHDTHAGRYLQVRRGRGPDEWVTLTPADRGKISVAVRELAAEMN